MDIFAHTDERLDRCNTGFILVRTSLPAYARAHKFSQVSGRPPGLIVSGLPTNLTPYLRWVV